MSRRLLVAGNWKMNLGLGEALALARSIKEVASHTTAVDVAIFPSFPWLVPVGDAVREAPVAVGAQHCHTQPSGAFTGEVAAPMLVSICEYVLAGHSERRHVFGESDETVGQKVDAILAAGLRVVLCVGETLDERQAGLAEAVVARQLEVGLGNVSGADVARLTIAYEPVWAIGTGVPATPADAQVMCAFARARLTARFGEAGSMTRVLYGGSVTTDNAASLFSRPDVDGALVGGASLKAEAFSAIIATADAASRV